MSKSVLVLGAGGFIGSHLVRKLKHEGCEVIGADLKYPGFSATHADEFLLGDLRSPEFVELVFKKKFDEVYQLASDMGGAGYIFTGDNDAEVMYNSAQINLNVLNALKHQPATKIFYASSACIYPEHNQLDPQNPNCAEDSAYPANPDSEYGWEKLFSERLYLSFARNHNLQVRIARLHNVFGHEGVFKGGREKAPAAICRKVAEAQENSCVEIWGDGKQTRSFLFIDECLEGIERLMKSNYAQPINIGSDEMISINELAQKVIAISGKQLSVKNIDGPTGVRGRNSDNRLIKNVLKWAPTQPLEVGLQKTYRWIASQVA